MQKKFQQVRITRTKNGLDEALGIDDKFRPSLFTPSSYDEYANCAVTNGEASQESKGIKAHCMFNQLESFHCTTGMPPCLGKQLSTI